MTAPVNTHHSEEIVELQDRVQELAITAANAAPSAITIDHSGLHILSRLVEKVRAQLVTWRAAAIAFMPPESLDTRPPFEHWEFVGDVAYRDLRVLRVKDYQYHASFKKRGGVGAYMMLARKWDRIEPFVEGQHGCNILVAIGADQRPESLLDDIRDLRRYLLLIEAEAIHLGIATPSPLPDPGF